MSDFPQHLRCVHYLIPEQCDWCITAVELGRPVAAHVRLRIVQMSARTLRFHAPAPLPPLRRRRVVADKPRVQRSGFSQVAPARKDMLSPVFGKTFDPLRRERDAANIPAHLKS